MPPTSPGAAVVVAVLAVRAAQDDAPRWAGRRRRTVAGYQACSVSAERGEPATAGPSVD
jgi:hypothetical protein